MSEREILISGSGIAGLVLAWCLERYGFRPTIIEKSAELRTGGHAVDLWGTALDILEQMGLLAALEARRTQNDLGVMISPGLRPREIDLAQVSREFAPRQIEIMRGELVSALEQNISSRVDIIFDNSISSIDERAGGLTVTFEKGGSRDFSLVVGADGQHSNVRRIGFGEEARFSHYLGGYICGYTIPAVRELQGRLYRYVVPNKTVVVFPIRQSEEIAVAFLFRRPNMLNLHHEDFDAQVRVLQETFSGESWKVPHLLDRLDCASGFYFDAISQVVMPSCLRGRIALVGDAGYCPGPAVGGGTSLAVIGAYILAGELAEATGDHRRGLQNYQDAVRCLVAQSRAIGPAVMASLLPRSSTSIWAGMLVLPLLLNLPSAIRHRVPLLPRQARRAMRAVSQTPIKRYRSPMAASEAPAGSGCLTAAPRMTTAAWPQQQHQEE
jgi:2-polyprenyl-6-methoxyphenol hydroxylase-like FAD-dependent oxidoreductase